MKSKLLLKSLPVSILQNQKTPINWFSSLINPHTHKSYRASFIHFAKWLTAYGILELTPEPIKINVSKTTDTQHREWFNDLVHFVSQYLFNMTRFEVTLLLEKYLDDMLHGAHKYTFRTVQIRHAVLSWFFINAYRYEYVDYELRIKIPEPRILTPGRNMQGPTVAQAKKLLEKASSIPDPRAPVILSLLRFEGYRDHEIRQLNFEDIDLKKATVLMVRKKRDEPSAFPLSTVSLGALKTWISIRGKKDGPLFYGGENGSESGTRMSKNMITRIVYRVSAEAKVPNMSPHKIRHRACTDIVKTAVAQALPEEEILRLTGHSSRGALQPYYEMARSYKGPRAVLDALVDVEDEEN